MFDIAPTELLLVAFVAIIVIGPKDLPKAMRVVGYWVGKARGVARQFRSGFDAMVREAELEEMEKRWASENERIMREHPQGDAAALPSPDFGKPAEPIDEAGGATTDDKAAEAVESSALPEQATPVMVEKPKVEPAPDAAAPAAPDKAAS